MLREARLLPDLAAGLSALPALARAPRAAGEPVLVLPGYGAGDSSTALLRAFLRGLGYRAEGASPDVEHVEVPSTHSGLGFDARVLALVADRLARRR